MKSCPKCRSVYYDETLDFCTEDGSHLVSESIDKDEIPTVISNKTDHPLPEKTLELPNNFTNIKEPLDVQNKKDIQPNSKFDTKIAGLKEKVSYQGLKTLEILPIIFALANNYWQWLYLNKNNFGDTLSFLISVNFIVWAMLFISGLIFSFLALKYGKNKGFAVTSLVILAVNLLLSIVPLK